MSIEMLDELEARIRTASDRLRSLRQENQDLSARVAELEGELEKVGESAEADAWAEEKKDVQQRLVALTETLDELLASS